MPQYIENFLHALNIAYSNLIKNEAHSENLTGKFKNPKNFENASCFCNEVRKAIICFEKRNSMDTPPRPGHAGHTAKRHIHTGSKKSNI